MARSRNRGNLDGRIPDARRRYRTLETGAAPADEQTPLERAQAAQAQRVGPVLSPPIGVGGAPGADLDVHGDSIVRESFRVQGGFVAVPAGWAGIGMESLVAGGEAYIQSFDRTSSVYAPLRLVGNPIKWYIGGSGAGEVNGTGVDIAGAYHVSGTQVVGPQIAGWPGYTTGAYSVGAVYSQAEVTALANAIVALQSTMDSLIGALRTHGLLGP